MRGAWQVFALGHKNRATASTNMNEHSSRSHALLRIRVVGTSRTTGNKTTGAPLTSHITFDVKSALEHHSRSCDVKMWIVNNLCVK